MAEERLQKILSAAGVTSRRKAEQMIAEGRVAVNGAVVTEPGSKADPERDHIKVDGKLLRHDPQHVYIALNKPDSVVSTVSDPQNRRTVIDLLRGVRARVYPVGRLDYHSEGLILLTNDGEFANAVASKGHVPKTYLVKIKGALTPEQEKEFRGGISLSGRRTAPAQLKLIRTGENPWYEVTIVEGRYQQIRIMFKHFGHLVEKLRRIRIGTMELGKLRPGEFRFLAADEVARLMRMARGDARRETAQKL
jgi:23S rRNA pseudouridine2605 synthase